MIKINNIFYNAIWNQRKKSVMIHQIKNNSLYNLVFRLHVQASKDSLQIVMSQTAYMKKGFES